MNDYLDWPREEIADWLCRAGDCKHEVKGGGELPVRKSEVVHLEAIEVGSAPSMPKPNHAYARTPRPAKRQILEPSDFHNLAEAMRRGCSLRPKKVKGVWKRGTTGACAVGAIAEGAGFTGNSIPWEKIWKMFPEMKGFMRHPVTGCSMEVWQVISSVSENTDYSREQIADWLCIVSGCTHSVQTSGLNSAMAA